MSSNRRITGSAGLIAALVLGYLAVYLVNLDTRPLARMDEFRYSEIAREMLASNNWVAPRLNGMRYFEKPVLGYWVGAAAIELFGENNFASRLPSALAAGLTALFIGFLGTRLWRDRATGMLAAFIYLTSLGVFAIGTINTLDSLLTLWLTVTIGGYLWAWQETVARRRRLLKLAIGISCGLAFLTKGFLALVVPLIVVVPFLAWRRQWKELFTGLWLPFGLAFVVAVPWALLIHQQEPDFWRYFFWEEHIRRFAADNAQHSNPFWFFFAALPAMALPWTFLFPAAVAGLRRQTQDKAVVGFVALWAVMPFLFYSIARGKLLPYILPCFPPLALLMAAGVREAIANADGAYIKQGLRGLMILWGALLVALLLNRFAGVGTPFFDGTENIRWGTLFAAIATGLVLGLLALKRGGRDLQLVGAGLAVVPLFLAIQFVIPNSTRLSKMPGAVLNATMANVPRDAVLISDGRYVHALAWIFKRNDIYLLNSGELTYGLSYPEDRHRLLTTDSFRRLVAGMAGRRTVFIVCDQSFDPMIDAALPDTARRISSGSMIIWQTAVAR